MRIANQLLRFCFTLLPDSNNNYYVITPARSIDSTRAEYCRDTTFDSPFLQSNNIIVKLFYFYLFFTQYAPVRHVESSSLILAIWRMLRKFATRIVNSFVFAHSPFDHRHHHYWCLETWRMGLNSTLLARNNSVPGWLQGHLCTPKVYTEGLGAYFPMHDCLYSLYFLWAARPTHFLFIFCLDLFYWPPPTHHFTFGLRWEKEEKNIYVHHGNKILLLIFFTLNFTLNFISVRCSP